MMLVLPTRPSTLSCSTSFVASAAICCGSICSVSAVYWIGRPLMPPLSFTQSKYAFVMPVIHVKSMPGTLVAMPPSLIGSPLAFWPVPAPHLPGACRLLLLAAPAVVVAPPAAVVADPEAAVVAAAVVAAAVVAAAAAVVAVDDDELSPPQAAMSKAEAALMATNDRFIRSSPSTGGVARASRNRRAPSRTA